MAIEELGALDGDETLLAELEQGRDRAVRSLREGLVPELRQIEDELVAAVEAAYRNVDSLDKARSVEEDVKRTIGRIVQLAKMHIYALKPTVNSMATSLTLEQMLRAGQYKELGKLLEMMIEQVFGDDDVPGDLLLKVEMLKIGGTSGVDARGLRMIHRTLEAMDKGKRPRIWED